MTRRRYLHRKRPERSDDPDRQPSAGRKARPTSPHDPADSPVRQKRTQPQPKSPPQPRPDPNPKTGRPTPPDKATTGDDASHNYQAYHYGLLALLIAIGLALRLRDPLSTSVIGAEDPYLHMERTWNLLQGHGVQDYPVGFMVLLAPFAMAGEQAFYYAVRFLPPLFGGAAVATTFFLCRPYLHPAGSLTAAGLIAVMPEHIMRTTLMFPTALDLAILPVLALAVLRIPDGATWAYWTAGILGAVLLFIHPWVVGLLLPVLATFLLLTTMRHGKHAGWAAGASVFAAVALVGLLWLLPVWTPGELAPEAASTARQLLADPGSASAVPQHVDLPWMLTWPGLILAGVGALAAIRRRSDFAILGGLWTIMMLPIVLIDWFGIWYLPHRTVAFLSVGVVMLAGLAVSEGVRLVRDTDVNMPRAAYLGIVGVVLLLAIPTTAAMDGWYRLYDEDDYAAWEAIDERDPSLVVTGSWQARAGYRGLTGQEAVYNPQFFTDQGARDHDLAQNPDLIVLVDAYATEENQLPTEFLQDWERIGQWGDTSAYQQKNGDNST